MRSPENYPSATLTRSGVNVGKQISCSMIGCSTDKPLPWSGCPTYPLHADKISTGDQFQSRFVTISCFPGCLNAVWPKIFGPVFLGVLAMESLRSLPQPRHARGGERRLSPDVPDHSASVSELSLFFRLVFRTSFRKLHVRSASNRHRCAQCSVFHALAVDHTS